MYVMLVGEGLSGLIPGLVGLAQGVGGNPTCTNTSYITHTTMYVMLVGEGLSGLIPGLVGLAQGVGGDPTCTNTSYIIHNDTTNENHTEWIVVPEYAPPNFSVQVRLLLVTLSNNTLFQIHVVSTFIQSYIL